MRCSKNTKLRKRCKNNARRGCTTCGTHKRKPKKKRRSQRRKNPLTRDKKWIAQEIRQIKKKLIIGGPAYNTRLTEIAKKAHLYAYVDKFKIYSADTKKGILSKLKKRKKGCLTGQFGVGVAVYGKSGSRTSVTRQQLGYVHRVKTKLGGSAWSNWYCNSKKGALALGKQLGNPAREAIVTGPGYKKKFSG